MGGRGVKSRVKGERACALYSMLIAEEEFENAVLGDWQQVSSVFVEVPYINGSYLYSVYRNTQMKKGFQFSEIRLAYLSIELKGFQFGEIRLAYLSKELNGFQFGEIRLAYLSKELNGFQFGEIRLAYLSIELLTLDSQLEKCYCTCHRPTEHSMDTRSSSVALAQHTLLNHHTAKAHAHTSTGACRQIYKHVQRSRFVLTM